ncbi:MAG: nucleotide exchange factor GrpE [Patescibacteria group bacterium]|nr:nucleotide exchange factor GrpE [Patescibacteria group bacterium]
MSKKDVKYTEEKKQETEELENKYKRALADYQNLEKRVAEQKSEWAKSANRELLQKLLPVLDNLELALKHIEDEGLTHSTLLSVNPELAEGLKIGVTQFLNALKSEGVTKIEVLGKEFDPNSMECVGTVSGEENKVIEEIRPGYTLFDRVLRPAQVRVGQARTEKVVEKEQVEIVN